MIYLLFSSPEWGLYFLHLKLPSQSSEFCQKDSCWFITSQLRCPMHNDCFHLSEFADTKQQEAGTLVACSSTEQIP